ncbi:hypothetical protein F511_24220 [Dorcoceras hygrometricum]|uniref:Uncharacterized protein n=1 Tax=Dorcoceras hygrometricum TaxID=472368 RepID=A0A2Z7ARF5_9LAMI|nr:hypothetical protein F511_24220 [Dorcoceras hygrometricum]
MSTGYAIALKLMTGSSTSSCVLIHSNSWYKEALVWMSCCLRLDFLLYDVASLLCLDVQATCWFLRLLDSNHLLIMMTSPMTSSTLSHLLILQHDVASSLSLLFSSADSQLLIVMTSLLMSSQLIPYLAHHLNC